MKSGAIPILAAIAACALGPTAFSEDAGAAPIKGVQGPAPGAYSRSVTLRPEDSGPPLEYRFQGQERWYAFDRALELGAFKGEERGYAVEFREGPSSRTRRLDYLIDRAPPAAPAFSIPSGDVGPALAVGVSGPGAVFLSVGGQPFRRLAAGEAPSFSAPAKGTSIVEAAAYSVDELGNASATVYSRWRLHPAGFAPSFPIDRPPPGPSLKAAEPAEAQAASIVDMAGSARVTVPALDGGVACVAVNPPEPLGEPGSYVELPAGQDSTIIRFPWGYEREIKVYYGWKTGSSIKVAPKPLSLSPSFPESKEAPLAIEAPAPILYAVGGTWLVEWAAGTLDVWVSIAGDDFVRYEAPFVLGPAGSAQAFRYYAVGPGGAQSEVVGAEAPAMAMTRMPSVAGVEDGKVYGTAPTIIPAPGTRVLYSISVDGAGAQPIAAGGPILPPSGLKVEGREGAFVRYTARFASDGEGSPLESYLSFAVDREPPPVPVAVKPGQAGDGQEPTLAFRPNPGRIFVSLSEDGRGPFSPLDGTVPAFAEDQGRRRYVVRAYSEDEFGNRSAEMAPVELFVDRSSVYVDQAGARGAAGTPDDPFLYLDEAIAAAEAKGKRFVYVRGSVGMRGPAIVKGRLEVRGGFGEGWDDDPGAMARVASALSSGYPITVEGGRLTLDRVALSAKLTGNGGIVEVKGGFLDVSNSSLEASGGIESVAVSAKGSKLGLEQSSIRVASCLAGRGLDLDGGSLALDGVSIACDRSVRAFDAVRLSGAQGTLIGLRLDCEPDYSFSGVLASRSTVRIERALAQVRGGTSTCRLVAAEASRVDALSSYLDVSWKGSADVAVATSGSTLRMANLTAIVDSGRSTLVNASSSVWTLVNSIAVFSGKVSTLAKADAVPAPGSVVANRLWGFSTLIEGAGAAGRIDELNAYAEPGYPNALAEPGRMFSGTVKGLRRLAKDSPCVDSGAPVDWASRLDLFGARRVSARGKGKPDIGAEELD